MVMSACVQKLCSVLSGINDNVNYVLKNTFLPYTGQSTLVPTLDPAEGLAGTGFA